MHRVEAVEEDTFGIEFAAEDARLEALFVEMPDELPERIPRNENGEPTGEFDAYEDMVARLMNACEALEEKLVPHFDRHHRLVTLPAIELSDGRSYSITRLSSKTSKSYSFREVREKGGKKEVGVVPFTLVEHRDKGHLTILDGLVTDELLKKPEATPILDDTPIRNDEEYGKLILKARDYLRDYALCRGLAWEKEAVSSETLGSTAIERLQASVPNILFLRNLGTLTVAKLAGKQSELDISLKSLLSTRYPRSGMGKVAANLGLATGFALGAPLLVGHVDQVIAAQRATAALTHHNDTIVADKRITTDDLKVVNVVSTRDVARFRRFVDNTGRSCLRVLGPYAYNRDLGHQTLASAAAQLLRENRCDWPGENEERKVAIFRNLRAVTQRDIDTDQARLQTAYNALHAAIAAPVRGEGSPGNSGLDEWHGLGLDLVAGGMASKKGRRAIKDMVRHVFDPVSVRTSR